MPFLTVLLTVSFGNKGQVLAYVQAVERGYVRNVDRLLPRMDPSQAALLKTAQVRESDPIICLDGSLGNLLPPQSFGDKEGARHLISEYRSWLPTTPWALFLPLAEERKILYVNRFCTRRPMSGWLLYPRNRSAEYAWLFDEIERTHRADQTFANDQWQLTWYECIQPVPAP
jgi:hypothetical protein